jgi:hypothetical protein
MCSQ